MRRIPYDELFAQFERVLLKKGFDAAAAQEAATVFAQNSLDGIYSHGINRFSRVARYLDSGMIDPTVTYTVEKTFGALEQWNGHRGFGPLNAKRAMDKACALAKEHGIGLVALGNNNHWMRGGSYGWQAANQGMIGICWSNTIPNMPAWGGVDPKLGNNPLVISVPRADGKHVVMDSAMSQFSYGKLEEYRLKGEQLPQIGGYDRAGKLSTDPGEIEATRRLLPMGFWKGSGLSLMLDIVGAVLSNGNSTVTIGTFDEEVGVTQMMIAIDPAKFNETDLTEQIVKNIIDDLHNSTPITEGQAVRYPGEREYNTRYDNMEHGIPVVEEKWQELLVL